MPNTVYGTCPWCGKKAEIQNSHSVPRTYFRKAKRGGSGQALIVADDGRPTQLSNIGGGGYLLCANCEGLFNKNFDKPCIESFRSIKHTLDCGSRRRVFDFDYTVFVGFICSVLWREANLPSEATFGFEATPQEMEIYRRAIDGEPTVIRKAISIRMAYLFDRLGKATPDQIEGIVGRPWRRRDDSVSIIMAGFAIDVHIPRLSTSIRTGPGFFLPNNRWRVLKLHIADVNRIMGPLAASHGADRRMKKKGGS